MSIKFRRSLLFDQPSRTMCELRVIQAIDHIKSKLHLNQLSVSQPKKPDRQFLNLSQAKKLQRLCSNTNKISLHKVLQSYSELCTTQELGSTEPINKQKLLLFHKGIYYSSKQRSRGSGTKPINIKSMQKYYNRLPEQQEQQQYNDSTKRLVRSSCSKRKQINILKGQQRISSCCCKSKYK